MASEGFPPGSWEHCWSTDLCCLSSYELLGFCGLKVMELGIGQLIFKRDEAKGSSPLKTLNLEIPERSNQIIPSPVLSWIRVGHQTSPDSRATRKEPHDVWKSKHSSIDGKIPIFGD